MSAKLVGLRMIADAKVTRYLLDPDHPSGADKARFFMSLGFDRTRPEEFIAALLRHAADRPISAERPTEGGVNRLLRCQVIAPDGRDPCMVTIWFQPSGQAVHRLVTAYPAKEKAPGPIGPSAPRRP